MDSIGSKIFVMFVYKIASTAQILPRVYNAKKDTTWIELHSSQKHAKNADKTVYNVYLETHVRSVWMITTSTLLLRSVLSV